MPGLPSCPLLERQRQAGHRCVRAFRRRRGGLLPGPWLGYTSCVRFRTRRFSSAGRTFAHDVLAMSRDASFIQNVFSSEWLPAPWLRAWPLIYPTVSLALFASWPPSKRLCALLLAYGLLRGGA